MRDCSDVEASLDAFVDSELSPTEQIDVARHLAGCSACNAVVERLLALRAGLTSMAESARQAIPLAAVWPVVTERLDVYDRQRWWRRGGRSSHALPMWAAGIAMAASALLMFRAMQPVVEGPPDLGTRRFAKHAVIERVVGNVDVRHDVKNGAPLILVNHTGEVRSR